MSAIDDKYFALGGPGGFLGQPVDEGAGSQEMDTADHRGRCRDFQGGSIYWAPQIGAYEVHGDIRIKWAQLGFLGFPVTDEYWTPETGAHEVHGAIRDKWASMGWERSRLGYPISDEKGTSGGRGRVSEFQGGAILWTPEGGADVRSHID